MSTLCADCYGSRKVRVVWGLGLDPTVGAIADYSSETSGCQRAHLLPIICFFSSQLQMGSVRRGGMMWTDGQPLTLIALALF